jgi:RimJ/RimL family protein N-acetyltransferase
MIVVRTLGANDFADFARLRRQALLETPLAFAASPETDAASSPDVLRSPVFGAFDGGLVGMAGLLRDRHAKSAHKIHLWGMYVEPSHRGHGVAAKLLNAAIDHARSLPGVAWIHLDVTSAAPEARRLYERVGFRVWGTENDALRHEGQSVDEYRMALRL